MTQRGELHKSGRRKRPEQMPKGCVCVYKEKTVLTDDFDELGDEHAVLQVVSHVVDQRQFRPLPQLRIHPRRVRLMMQSTRRNENKTKKTRDNC